MKLTFEGLFPFKTEQSIVLGEQHGLFLITGKNYDMAGNNGSGKSSIVDILSYSLYGKTARDIYIDSIWHEGNKKGKAILELDKDFIVQRGYDGVFINNKKYDTKAANELIINKIGLDFNSFLSSVYFVQGTFGFALKSDNEKKAILTKLLNLEKWDERKKKVSEKIEQLEVVLFNLKENISFINGQKSNLEQQRDSYSKTINKWENEHIQSLNCKEKELSELKLSILIPIDEIHKKLDELSDLHKSTNLQYNKEGEALTNELSSVVSTKLSELTELKKELNEKYNKKILDFKNKYSIVINQIGNSEKTMIELGRNLKQVDDNLNKLKLKQCPTCNQNVNEDIYTSLSNQYIKTKFDIGESLKKEYLTYSELCVEKENKEKEIKELQEELKSSIADILLLEKEEEDKLNKEKEEIKNKIYNLRNEQNNFIDKIVSEQEQLNNQILLYKKLELLEKEINNKKKETNPYIDLRVTTINELDKVNKDILLLEEDKKDCEALLMYYTEIKKIFSDTGVKSFIFDSIIPEFEELANIYCREISNGQIGIRFDTQTQLKSGTVKEKFNILVEDNKGEREFNAWSGGEKKRMSIAIDLALATILQGSNRYFNFIIFDELFDALDITGIYTVLNLLTSIESQKSIYIITQNEDIRDLFDKDKIIYVEKKYGESNIIQL